jgi:RNA polymerase sigma-70 factor (ECF subfamily)
MQALAKLSAEQRRIVELSYFEGLSSSDMARALDIPLGTVKSRMAAARAALRASMGVLVSAE